MRRVGRMFFEGYEENVMKRVMSDTIFKLNMRNATEMREGKPATSQLFLFAKHYLSPTYNETASHRVLIRTTTFVPPLMDVDMTSSSFHSSFSHHSNMKVRLVTSY